MNENDRHEAFEATAQGELYREVVDIYAEPENFPREEASPFAERILQLIDKAVAARDAEIREALLDGEWLDLLHDELHAGMYWDTDDSRPIPDETYAHECLPYHVVRDQIEARLKHIGLAEEGAER